MAGLTASAVQDALIYPNRNEFHANPVSEVVSKYS